MLPPGNWNSRENVIEGLKALRRHLCGYARPGMTDEEDIHTCDCKYPGGITPIKITGEHTGCCELRCAISILERMSDEDYQRAQRPKMKVSVQPETQQIKCWQCDNIVTLPNPYMGDVLCSECMKPKVYTK